MVEFNERSAKRIADVVRHVERSPQHLKGAKRGRRITLDVPDGTTYRVVPLEDGLLWPSETIDDDNVNVNAKIYGTSPPQYLRINKDWREGYYHEVTPQLVIKCDDEWRLVTPGACYGPFTATGYMGAGGAPAWFYDPEYEQEIRVYPQGDLSGIKEGMSGTCMWDNFNKRFVVIALDDQFTGGEWGEQINDCDIVSPFGIEYSEGHSVYCVFKNGQYVVMGHGPVPIE